MCEQNAVISAVAVVGSAAEGVLVAGLAPLPFGRAGLPDAVRRTLDHAGGGQSLRALARRDGCHASTVMRQIRRYEARRGEPLMDGALIALLRTPSHPQTDAFQENAAMSAPIRSNSPHPPDDAQIRREAARILRSLTEPGAVLAIAAGMDKAVVLRGDASGPMIQTAVVDRAIAEAFAVRDWISCVATGRVATYAISPAGRVALTGMAALPDGFAEAQTPFGRQVARDASEDTGPQRGRYFAAESPVLVLARRRDRDGLPFLASGLVDAAERLREDFELAQMGPRVTQNWERFLTTGDRGPGRADAGLPAGPRAARDRVALALRDLGPGLGDAALRCCCYQEGLETVEQRLGWAARSGKIVLRIALQRLRRHYDETYGRSSPLIG